MREKRRLMAAFLLPFLLLRPPLSLGVDYTYDQDQSTVEFFLKHLGMTTAEGHFKTFTGTSRFFADNIESSEVNIQILTASIHQTNNPARNNTLRSEKFFWSEKYPAIQFMSRRFVKTSRSEFNIEGDLTIRGITLPAVFHTQLLTDPAGITEKQPLFFTASTFIKRKDYKLGTEDWASALLAFTHETLEIRLRVKCNPEKTSKSSRRVVES